MTYTLSNSGFTYQPHEWKRPSGEKITYFDEGTDQEGTPLLFIHGLGNNALVWFKMIRELSVNHRCIAVDLPAHGFSTNKQNLSITYLAESVKELADHLGLEKVILVGHSMGGQISTKVALDYPDRLSRLVLLAPAGFEVFSPKEKSWLKSIYATWLLKKLSKQRMMDQFKENFFFFEEDAHFFLEDLQRLRDKPEIFQHYCESLSTCMGAMLDEPVFDDLTRLSLPTLVIYGENDRIIPNPVLHPEQNLAEVASSGTEQIPQATLKMIPECGHMLQWEKAAEISQMIVG
jgi:pimeloyl-ACP methyl ester carboxylesterase